MAEKLVENIRRFCVEKGVSIMQMESDLGFSTGLISRWSKTKTCPSFDKIVDIMAYLDITYDELMENTKSSNVRKQEMPVNNENEDEKVIVQLEKGSISREIGWERAAEDMPFEVKTEMVFQNMLAYDIHRLYYAAYGKGWFLFSVQYSEETVDALMAVYMLAAAGMDMVKLDTSEEGALRLLKIIDEEIFNRINQAQVEKMKENFLDEDFQNRYRSVS